MTPSTNLRLVSLTGADDAVSLDDLQELSAKYPFVEWALLYGAKPGTPRNPTAAWREQFFERNLPTSSAIHLCFKTTFVDMVDGRLAPDVKKANRIQLNINARGMDFTIKETVNLFERALDLGPAIILQRHEGTAEAIQQFLRTLSDADRPRVHVLLDESRGTGKEPDTWVMPDLGCLPFVGVAGGIGPDNIHRVLKTVDAWGAPYWTDKESRIRTNNQLDREKVESVLAAAAPYWVDDNAGAKLIAKKSDTPV